MMKSPDLKPKVKVMRAVTSHPLNSNLSPLIYVGAVFVYNLACGFEALGFSGLKISVTREEASLRTLWFYYGFVAQEKQY